MINKLSKKQKKVRSRKQCRSTDQVYGLHSVESVVINCAERIIQVFLLDIRRQDNRFRYLFSQMDILGINYQLVNKSELNQLSREAAHQGVIALVRSAIQKREKELEDHLKDIDNVLILVFDQIQDPHNLGACLRTAESAGVDAVILLKNRSCPITQTVRKVAVGAVDRLSIFYVTNLSRTLKKLQQMGIWIIGATDKAEQYVYGCDLTGNIALLMGAEGQGLRKLTMKNCDLLVKIPMMGSVSSLNVSVATGVLLFETIRQRESI